jgi:hypothetical protein
MVSTKAFSKWPSVQKLNPIEIIDGVRSGNLHDNLRQTLRDIIGRSAARRRNASVAEGDVATAVRVRGSRLTALERSAWRSPRSSASAEACRGAKPLG